jgi:hypothetical protein
MRVAFLSFDDDGSLSSVIFITYAIALIEALKRAIVCFRQVSIHQRRTNGGSETSQSRTANRAKAHGVTSPQADFV